MSTQEQIRVPSADEVRDLLVQCLKPLIEQEKVAGTPEGSSEVVYPDVLQARPVADPFPCELGFGEMADLALVSQGGQHARAIPAVRYPTS